MRYLKSLSLFFLIIFGATCATPLNKTQIAHKAIIIEKKMIQDRYIFYGLTGLSIVYQLSQSFAELKKAFDASAAEQKVAGDNKKTSFLQALKAIPSACAAGMRHLVCTQEGWVTTMQFGIAIGSSIFAAKMCEKFAHPDTLRWYVSHYAPYYLTIKMMRKYLVDIQDQVFDQNHMQTRKEMANLLFARLVRQVELICAYMTYKIKRLDDEEKAIAEREKFLMIACHNDWLTRISAQLTGVDRDYAQIDALLGDYEKDIRSHINHFAVIEGEMPHERRAIKEQANAQLHEEIN